MCVSTKFLNNYHYGDVMLYLAFVIFPVLFSPYIAKLIWKRNVKGVEVAIAGAIGILAAAIVYACGLASQTGDTELINGEVMSKDSQHVSCSHSYDCNCRMVRVPQTCSGTGKNRTCTGGGTERKCDTCYEHSFDVDWNVRSNVGSFGISRVDRQGLIPPPRWLQVNNGDPVAKTHYFTNYVKAVPESLFHAHMELNGKFDNMIPAYPSNVYDIYKIDRALSVGVPVPDLKEWSQDISVLLRKLGPQRQANVIVIFVNTADESYLHALEGKWIGGKKNDIIVLVGSTSYPKIDWVAISSWTDKALFKVQLRDDILSVGSIDRPAIMKAIDTNVMKTFERKQMKDFEYLKYSIEPPFWVLTLAIVLGMIASLGCSYLFYRNNTQFSRYR